MSNDRYVIFKIPFKETYNPFGKVTHRINYYVVIMLPLYGKAREEYYLYCIKGHKIPFIFKLYL